MDKVQIIDNAIDLNIVNDFVNIIDKDKFIDINKSSYAQNQTDFQIKFYKDDFHVNPKYQKIREQLLQKISSVVGYQLPSPKVYRNFMLKYNEPGMRSALHVEHQDIHGKLGFLFYLTNEDSGYLRWVDEKGEENYFSKYPNEKEDFVNNYGYRQHYGDIKVQPKFNRLVIFETLGSHLVDKLESSVNELPRLCIMGWPLCEV